MAWTRSWRFDGLEMGIYGAGPAITPAGGIAMIEDETAIRQSLMVLLSTIPGERVMRPEYGCPLHRLAFEQNDDTTAGLAIHYVRQAVTRFETRIEITRLDAGRAADAQSAFAEAGNRLFVHLEYRVRGSLRAGQVRLEVDLAGPSA